MANSSTKVDSRLDTTAGYSLLFGVLILATIAIHSSKLFSRNESSPNLKSQTMEVYTKKSLSWTKLGISIYASCLGSWILFAPPEIGATFGFVAVILYSLGVAVSMLIMIIVGNYVKNNVTEGEIFGLCDFIKFKYGKKTQYLAQLVTLMSMLFGLAGELVFVSNCFKFLVSESSSLVPVIFISTLTLINSSFSGLWGAILNNIIQGSLVLILSMLDVIAVVSSTKMTYPSWNKSFASNHKSVICGLLMILSILPSYLIDQGAWQRVLFCKDSLDIAKSFSFGAVVSFLIMFLFGFAGIIGKVHFLEEFGSDYVLSYNDLSCVFFSSIKSMSRFWIGFTLVLSLFTCISTIESIQSALPTLILNNVYNNEKDKNQTQNCDESQLSDNKCESIKTTNSLSKNHDFDPYFYDLNVKKSENNDDSDLKINQNFFNSEKRRSYGRIKIIIFTALVNIASISIAIFWSRSVILLYLIYNVLSALLIAPVLMDIKLKSYNDDYILISFICGFISLFISGLIHKNGDLLMALQTYVLVDGLDSLFTLSTFLLSFIIPCIVLCILSFLDPKKCKSRIIPSHTDDKILM